MLHGFHCALDVDEVSVRETSWLSRTSVDGNTDVDDVSDALEKVVQVTVRHLEGHVSDEESLGGRVEWSVGSVEAAWTLAGLKSLGLVRSILHGEAAAFEELLVESFNGFGGRIDGFKVDVTKSTEEGHELATDE